MPNLIVNTTDDHMRHINYARLSCAWVLLLGLFGCATSVDVSQVNINNPLNELKMLKENLQKARQEHVSVLSPRWFKTASQNINKANKLSSDGNTAGDFVTAIATAKQALNRANHFAKVAAVEIAPAIAARDAAIKARVPELYPSEFEIAEQRFSDLARYIEQDSVKTARNETRQVQSRYQELKIRAIKEHKMGDARKLIKMAEKQSAHRYVPTTLDVAKKKLKATDEYIEKKPHGPDVQRRADDLLKAARHLKIAMDTVSAWSRLKLEDVFVSMEDRIISIQKLASGAKDRNMNQSLEEHFHTIEENIKSRLESQKFLNEEVTRLQGELKVANKEMKSLSEVKRKRQEEQKFQAKFQRVAELFNPNEAEIYRQGTTLLVRLKGMNFEVGKSYILPHHYPILNKVQKAIRIFGTQRAVIEGHTDSTGGTAQNKVLSQQRADAVMAYLVNNGAMDPNNITSIGYGPDKPIAPNTSNAGRKLNRRIDVVLLVDN